MNRNNLSALCFFVAASIGAATTAFAQHVNGNGGTVVDCMHDGVRSVIVYDTYEARRLYPEFVRELGAASSYRDMIDHVLTRLSRLSPVRANLYRSQVAAFEAEARMLNGPLVRIDDMDAILAPEDEPECHVRQIVIQKPPRFEGDRRYTVDNALWALLSEEEKATLVLHEIIYREAISYGQNTSVAVRYFNNAILSGDFAQYGSRDFYRLLLSLKFDRYEYDGFVLQIFNDNNVDCDDPTFALNFDHPLDESGNFSVQANGAPDYLMLACGSSFTALGTSIPVGGKWRLVRYYPLGGMRVVRFFSDPIEIPYTFPRSGLQVVLVGGGSDTLYFEFYENGSLKYGDVRLPVTLTAPDGHSVRCAASAEHPSQSWETINFDESGYAVAWETPDICSRN